MAEISWDEFRALTPGERMARRGHIRARPGQDDYELQALLELEEVMRRNPFVLARVPAGWRLRLRQVAGDLAFVLEVP